jgi:hypothetical protein
MQQPGPTVGAMQQPIGAYNLAGALLTFAVHRELCNDDDDVVFLINNTLRNMNVRSPEGELPTVNLSQIRFERNRILEQTRMKQTRKEENDK